jgi:potassium-dependent mechanosensitive channel
LLTSKIVIHYKSAATAFLSSHLYVNSSIHHPLAMFWQFEIFRLCCPTDSRDRKQSAMLPAKENQTNKDRWRGLLYSFGLVKWAVIFFSIMFAVPAPALAQVASGANSVSTSGSNASNEQDPVAGENGSQANGSGNGSDQAAPADALRVEENIITRIDAIEATSAQIQTALQSETLTDEDLSKLRSQINAVRQEAQDISLLLGPRVQAIEQRLQQLGEAPADGEAPEAEAVTKERTAQESLLTEISGAVTRAKLLTLTAGQTATVISDRRRAHFADRIFERRYSVLDPALWQNFMVALPVAVTRFNLLMSDWFGIIAERATVWLPVTVVGILAIALLMVWLLRRLAGNFAYRSRGVVPISPYSKVSHGVRIAIGISAIPTLTTIAIALSFGAFDLMPARISALTRSEILNVALFFFALGLLSALLAPRKPKLRISNIDDEPARKLFVLMISAVGIIVFDDFFDQLGTVLFTPLDLTIAKGAIASLIIAFLFALVAKTIGKALNAPAVVDTRRQPGVSPIRWRWLQIVCWFAVAAIPLAAVLGYLSLAHFIATEIVVATIILGALRLAMMYVDAVLMRGIGVGGPQSFAERFGQSVGIRRSSIEQAAIILNGLVRLLLIMFALSLLLFPWGFETKDIFVWLRTAFFGFSVGEITISVSSILQATGIFILGILATRTVQRWLENRYLPYTNLDVGVRNSLVTTIGYIGIIIAATVGFSYLGFDLSSLALVAGALSLGIGFGLQSIVNNFVSGLILLAERPIKTGDWIIAGSDEGYVRKISVRSTEIETFDGATVIVPNSNLISGVVTNLMHGNSTGRVKIPIGVGYNSDPEQVQDILLEIVSAHPDVLKDPAPRVYFLDFGDSALLFEVRIHLKEVDYGISVKSDLRMEILKKLREANIEIPFPQQDVHLHYADKAKKATPRKSTARPARRARKRAIREPMDPDDGD